MRSLSREYRLWAIGRHAGPAVDRIKALRIRIGQNQGSLARLAGGGRPALKWTWIREKYR